MANPAGSFICYELRPLNRKRSSRAGTIEAQPSGDMEYRMITRSDNGNSGGVLRLIAEMQGHGARPCWLGYVGVPDVDAAVARVEEDGGRTLMPGYDIGGVAWCASLAAGCGPGADIHWVCRLQRRYVDAALPRFFFQSIFLATRSRRFGPCLDRAKRTSAICPPAIAGQSSAPANAAPQCYPTASASSSGGR